MDADVIPFPRALAGHKRAAPPVPGVDRAGQERLAHALVELRDALEEQRRVLGEWRYAMAELSIGVVGLGYSLESYQNSLSGVQTRLKDLRTESERMQSWAAADGSKDVLF
jgi:hypothetical protein